MNDNDFGAIIFAAFVALVALSLFVAMMGQSSGGACLMQVVAQ